MGLPTTWTLLSLLHLYWLRKAVGGKEKRGVICGDDLLALFTSLELKSYRDSVLSTGGKLHPLKTFVST